jgi:hypothetical protein
MGKKYTPSSTESTDSYPVEGSRKPDGVKDGGNVQTALDDRQDYAIFISHSWDYEQEFARLRHLLKGSDDIEVRDYSVPEDEKFEGKTDEELERVLREKQIKPSSVVVVLAGLYSTHSDWIEKEIKIAEAEGKPILGVEPWGSDRTSTLVKEHADEMVGWNTESVVDGIKMLAP